MADVVLVFMYRAFGGGTTTFTAHLAKALALSGHSVDIIRVRQHSECRQVARGFAGYEGMTYHNVGVDEALRLVKSKPSLMTAPCNAKHLEFDPQVIGKLIKAGMRVVVHDPTEFEIYDALDGLSALKLRRPICIRLQMREHLPTSVYVPHPYVREFSRDCRPPEHNRTWRALCVSRVTFKKRIEVMAAANRLMSKKNMIHVCGGENRMYTHHKLFKDFPEMRDQQQFGFPSGWGVSARLCARAKFAVDLSWFKDDGGGTQYTFMEAWDAGTINIISTDWLSYSGEMVANRNCLSTRAEPRALADVVECAAYDNKLVEAGYKALRIHDPEAVSSEIMHELLT